MSERSEIEWLASQGPDGVMREGSTWNPTRGCGRESPGCMNCYAEAMARRFCGPGGAYEGLLTEHGTWNDSVQLYEHMLSKPLEWKRGRRIFVNSTSDLFHRDVPFAFIDRVFAVMAQAHQHTFIILTKRAERMRLYLSDITLHSRLRRLVPGVYLPLPNVWVGVSAENQTYLNQRAYHLSMTPAARRIVSIEPQLGRISLTKGYAEVGEWTGSADYLRGEIGREWGMQRVSPLDWVIVGFESGAGARPAHPGWAAILRDECKAAGVPFFFKQFGRYSYHQVMDDGSFWPSEGVKPIREGLLWRPYNNDLNNGEWIEPDKKAPIHELLRPGAVYAFPHRKGATGNTLGLHQHLESPPDYKRPIMGMEYL